MSDPSTNTPAPSEPSAPAAPSTSTESAPVEAAAPPSSPATAATAETSTSPAAPSRPPVREFLSSLTPEERREALSVDWVNGTLGDLADKRAKALYPTLKEQEHEQTLSAEKADALARKDYVRVGEIEDELQERKAKQTAATEPAFKFASEVQNDLARVATELFGADVVNAVASKLAGKPLDGSFGEGTAQWVKHLADEATKANESKLFSKWEKERLPALRKQLLAEINGEEDTPDVGGGGSSPRRKWTPSDIAKLSAADFEKHKDEIYAQLPS